MHDYRVREIASGLGFLEGPMVLDDGTVLVVDVGASCIWAIDPKTGKTHRHVETGGGPNGIAPGPDGAIFVANNGGMAMTKSPEGINVPDAHSPPPKPLPPGIQRIDRDGKVTQLYTECGGNPLRWPNDLVFDAHGGFYFTDFGRDLGRTCDLGGLYYAKADGSSIVELIHEAPAFVPLTQPNGVGLSPAGDKVYVAETVTGRLWSWKVKSPGVLAPADQPMSPNGAGLMLGADGVGMLDSLAVDGEGYVCVATLIKGGISVVKPEGGLEDFIQIPGEPFVTNICFGGPDLRTAYVTASSQGKVWAMDWPRKGLRLNYAA